jgi:hexosaminidase
MKKLSFLITFLIISQFVFAQNTADYNVIPEPQSIELSGKPAFILNKDTRIIYAEGSAEMERNARFLQEYVEKNIGLRLLLSTNSKKPQANSIVLALDEKIEGDEAYKITVDNKNVIISALKPAGVFYGIQTVRKALPTGSLSTVSFPAGTVSDSPRFSYRGMMLDCGRHFFPVEFVKEYIDLLAMHNMNRFHWHLTEDQGWRIEIKKYPMLTLKGSVRKRTTLGRNSMIYDNVPYGGYYTQEQAREIVEYARQRYITVIPEIDMPGHQKSALACYPELGCTGGPYEVGQNWGVYLDILCLGNEKTYQFCEDVLSELMDIFPSEIIHIGGDEAPKERTVNCPKCKDLMAREGLNKDNVQGYFTNRIEKFVNSKGRRIMGWDEILEGDINQSATIHCWRGIEHGIKAAQAGHDVVMSPTAYCYFDYYQADPTKSDEPQGIGGYLPIKKVYEMDAVPSDISPENRKHIIGVQGNLWTEYIAYPSHAEYMVLPRMAALAEEQWCMKKGTFEAFVPRVTRLTKLYDLYNLQYAKHLWPDKIWPADRDF